MSWWRKLMMGMALAGQIFQVLDPDGDGVVTIDGKILVRLIEAICQTFGWKPHYTFDLDKLGE